MNQIEVSVPSRGIGFVHEEERWGKVAVIVSVPSRGIGFVHIPAIVKNT